MAMDRYKAICLDLAGRVYHGGEVIPEALNFIHELQNRGIEPFYITNNSSATTEQFQIKLLQLGIEARTDSIITSAVAAAKYCKEHFNGASVMMIGEEGLQAA